MLHTNKISFTLDVTSNVFLSIGSTKLIINSMIDNTKDTMLYESENNKNACPIKNVLRYINKYGISDIIISIVLSQISDKLYNK